jgi:hypothetical protein
MSEFPDPLTSADCDLRTYEWMPLDVNRLLTSETWILGTAEECKAAVTLWCESWRQVPAASVPDNDRILAHLSRAGAAWKKVKDAVMKSWIKCSDGRFYHPVVAEKARESFDLRNKQRERTEAARLAKEAKRLEKLSGGNAPPTTENATEDFTQPATISVTEKVTASNRTDQNRPDLTLKKERAETSSPAPASPPPFDPPDARTQFWTEGLALIRGLTGRPDAPSRAFLGKILKLLADDCDLGLQILRGAADLRPGGPEAWIVASCEARMARRSTGISARKEKILRAGGLWPDETGRPETFLLQ